MAEVHFFIEVDKLPVWSPDDPDVGQGPDRAYGPVAGKESEQYRVTSTFRLREDAMAYAVCRGAVLVQPQWDEASQQFSTTWVNVVLMPIPSPNDGFSRIDYFIYRGLHRGQFLDEAGEIIAKDSGNTEFIQHVWADYEAAIAQGLTEESHPSADRIGAHLDRLADDTLLEDVFFAVESTGSAVAPRQLTVAQRGMSLGTFSSTIDIGFEVVVKEKFYRPDLAMVRGQEHVISSKAPVANDSDPGGAERRRMRGREDVLNFLDPTAYFMTLYQGGVEFRRDADGPLERTELGSLAEIQDLLGGFFTKNTVYLDVRNEMGYSLNYYGDNQGQPGEADADKHLRISSSDPVADTISQLAAENYYQHSWPLYPVQLPPRQSSSHLIFLSFRTRFNPKPALYLDHAFVETVDGLPRFPVNSARFVDEPDRLSVPEWSGAFQIAVPNLPDVGTPAWISKVFLLRREQPAQLPPAAIPRQHYLENVFGPLLEEPKFSTDRAVKCRSIAGPRYVDARSELGVEMMVETSILFSAAIVVLLVSPVAIRGSSNYLLGGEGLNKLETGVFPVAGSLQAIERIFASTVSVRRHEVTPPGGRTLSLPVVLLGTTYKSVKKPFHLALIMRKSEYLERLLVGAEPLDSRLHEVFAHLGAFERHDAPTRWQVAVDVAGLAAASGAYQVLSLEGDTLAAHTLDARLITTEALAERLSRV